MEKKKKKQQQKKTKKKNKKKTSSPYLSVIGHSKMELKDVDFSFKNENNETDQGDCLTAFGYFKEMNNFFYMDNCCGLSISCL